MKPSLQRNPWTTASIAFGVFLVYSAAAKLGLSLAYVNASATAIWAPTGIALASFLVFGEQFFPSVFAGAFLVNYWTDGSIPTSALIAFGNTFEALLGALLIHEFAGGRRVFYRSADILKFALLLEPLATLVSPTVGVTALCLDGLTSWPRYWEVWSTWWLGDLSGALIFGPVLVLWLDDRSIRWKRVPLFIATMAAIAVTAQIVFGEWFFPVDQEAPELEFFCVPPLIWAAYQLGIRNTATGGLFISMIGLGYTLHHSGPFVKPSMNESLLLLQAFMSVLTVTSLSLSAAVTERDEAVRNLVTVERVKKELRENIGLIQLLQAITVSANQSNDLTEAVFKCLGHICRYTGWPVGHVYYVDPDGRHLTPGAQWFFREEAKFTALRQATEQLVLQEGEDLPGWVFATGQPQWIEDLELGGHFRRALPGKDPGVRSAFGVPIYHDKGIIAVLEFFSDVPAPANAEWMDHLKYAGAQLSRVLERQKLEEAQSNLALLVETSSDFIVTTAPDGTILYLNDAGRTLIGLPRDFNVHTLKHEDFIFPTDIPKLRGEVLTALIEKGHWEGEFFLRHFRTGESIPIYFSAGILKDPKTGAPTTLAAIGHDVTDIKKAEAALHHAQRYSQALIHNSLDIVTVLDVEGHYTFLSPSMHTLLGYQPEELIHTNAFAMIHPEDLEQVIAKFKKVLENPDITENVQFRFKLKDGSWKPLEAIGRNLLNDPSVRGVVVNSRDMTQQKDAEDEIRKTNLFLSTILENIPNMVFVKNAADLRFAMFNKAGEDLIGVPRQDLIGKNDYDFFTKEQADFFTLNDRKVLAQKRLVDIPEEPIQTQDKGTRILHTKKIPVFNDDGTPRFLMGISEDITDAKLAERTLRESEERFKLLVANVQDYAIYMLDPGGHVMTWNEGAQKVHGYRPSEITGKHFSVFYPNEQQAAAYPHQLLQRAVQEGHVNDMGWRIRKDGSSFWADVVITVLKDEGGAIRGFAKITRDISEKRAAELELQRQTTLLQSIIDNMGEGLLVCDDQGRTLFANPAADEMLGGHIGDPLPGQRQLKNSIRFVDEDIPLKPEDFPISKAIRGEASDNVELLIRNPSRPHGVYLVVTSRPIRNKEGRITGAVSVFRDITEQKKIEEEQQRLVTLVEHSRDMIVWSSPEGKNLYINEAGRRILGIDSDYPVDRITLESIGSTEDQEQVKAVRQNQFTALQERGFWEGEVDVPHQKTGQAVPIYFSIVMLRNPKTGKPIGTAAIGRDMTERKEAERHRREADMRFRAVVQSSPNAILIADKQGQVLSWNSGAERIFGYEEAEVFGRPITLLMSPVFREAHEGDIHSLHQGQPTRFIGSTSELTGLRKDGSEFPMELTLSYWRVEADIFFGCIIRDITERKKLEEALRSNTELQQFANVASHDLQEPLRMVASYVQLLAEHCKDTLDDDAKEYMGFAVDGAKRMQLLVNGLLEYSRVESRGKRPEPTDMNLVFDQTISNLEIRIAETGAVVTHDPLPWVMGDPVQLAQLLQNLFSNALKFQKKGVRPAIHLSAALENDQWVFACRDNGIGIDPRFFGRIFVIFQRLHHRDEYSGTGIGLAICKRIVERNGGKIWLESKMDQGSTFYFTLPKRQT